MRVQIKTIVRKNLLIHDNEILKLMSKKTSIIHLHANKQTTGHMFKKKLML